MGGDHLNFRLGEADWQEAMLRDPGWLFEAVGHAEKALECLLYLSEGTRRLAKTLF